MNLFENLPEETPEEKKARAWGVVGAITRAMIGTKVNELPVDTCPCCNARLARYRHSLNQALLTGLIRLNDNGGEANLKTLKLTRNQWDNFQKLRYWGLVKQVRQHGVRKRGVWAITKTGKRWLSGQCNMPKTVITFQGEAVSYEGEAITPVDVDPHYRQRIDYATDSIPLHEDIA